VWGGFGGVDWLRQLLCGSWRLGERRGNELNVSGSEQVNFNLSVVGDKSWTRRCRC
jgi:hypothetical protein